jgi:hypothetical protein
MSGVTVRGVSVRGESVSVYGWGVSEVGVMRRCALLLNRLPAMWYVRVLLGGLRLMPS